MRASEMLLILTNSRDSTADYLGSVLMRNRVQFLRFDTDLATSNNLVSYSKAVPRLKFGGAWLRPDEFKNVLYRRPETLKGELHDRSPETRFLLDEWSEALEGFFAHISKSRWMNHPSSNVMASHKMEQLSLARSVGMLVPDSLVTQDAGELREFFTRHNRMVVVKPLRAVTSSVRRTKPTR